MNHPASRRNSQGQVFFRLIVYWCVFWILNTTIALFRYLGSGRIQIWEPLVWELTSFLYTTPVMFALALQFKAERSITNWFRWHFTRLPLVCAGFVPSVFGMRHVIYAFLDLEYHHDSWAIVVLYESAKLVVFYLLWLGVVYAVQSHQRLAEVAARHESAKQELRNAELALLRQQLNPHMLFNALNLISSTMYEDVPKADLLLNQLADFLRRCIRMADSVDLPLREEIGLMQDYAAIMAARFEDRVHIDWRIPPELPNCRVPSLILQPLLENVFKHAVEPQVGMTYIGIGVEFTQSELRFVINQNRGWITAEPSAGQGLNNVRNRLATMYGPAAQLEIAQLAPEGACVTLLIPCAY